MCDLFRTDKNGRMLFCIYWTYLALLIISRVLQVISAMPSKIDFPIGNGNPLKDLSPTRSPSRPTYHYDQRDLWASNLLDEGPYDMEINPASLLRNGFQDYRSPIESLNKRQISQNFGVVSVVSLEILLVIQTSYR